MIGTYNLEINEQFKYAKRYEMKIKNERIY